MKSEEEIWKMIHELEEDHDNGFISRGECTDRVDSLKWVLSDD